MVYLSSLKLKTVNCMYNFHHKCRVTRGTKEVKIPWDGNWKHIPHSNVCRVLQKTTYCQFRCVHRTSPPPPQQWWRPDSHHALVKFIKHTKFKILRGGVGGLNFRNIPFYLLTSHCSFSMECELPSHQYQYLGNCPPTPPLTQH